MAYRRTFPQQTVGTTSTPQPLFSTTFNGAVTAQAILPPAQSGLGYLPVQVASSVGFRVGDVVALSPGTARFEYAKVIIIPDGTHLGVQGVSGLNYNGAIRAHSNGDFISLCLQITVLYVQRVIGDINILYLGGPNLNPSASPPVNIIASLAGVSTGQPQEFGDTNPIGKMSLGTYWVYGTAATVYNVTVTA